MLQMQAQVTVEDDLVMTLAVTLPGVRSASAIELGAHGDRAIHVRAPGFQPAAVQLPLPIADADAISVKFSKKKCVLTATIPGCRPPAQAAAAAAAPKEKDKDKEEEGGGGGGGGGGLSGQPTSSGQRKPSSSSSSLDVNAPPEMFTRPAAYRVDPALKSGGGGGGGGGTAGGAASVLNKPPTAKALKSILLGGGDRASNTPAAFSPAGAGGAGSGSNPSPPLLEDYVGPIEIFRAADGHGRGVRVTRPVEVGDLLMVSNPMACISHSFGADGGGDGSQGKRSAVQGASDLQDLLLQLQQRCGEDPVAYARLHSLWPLGADDVPDIELFKRGVSVLPSAGGSTAAAAASSSAAAAASVHVPPPADQASVLQAVRYNSYGENDEHGSVIGLWALPAFVNHSCSPNAARTFLGGAMVVRASKPIAKGGEVSYIYVDVSDPVDVRQSKTAKWKFVCDCRRCEVELASSGLCASLQAKASAMHGKGIQVSRIIPVMGAVAGKELRELPPDAEKGLPRVTVDEQVMWLQNCLLGWYNASTSPSDAGNAFFDDVLATNALGSSIMWATNSCCSMHADTCRQMLPICSQLRGVSSDETKRMQANCALVYRGRYGLDIKWQKGEAFPDFSSWDMA